MIYSIELGIDPDARNGKTGEAEDPYPMQISLCSGVFDEQGDFVPGQLSSWFMLQSRDPLLVRVFDLGDPAGQFRFNSPAILSLSLCDLDGRVVTEGPVAEEFSFTPAPGVHSPCYARPEGSLYPCYSPSAGDQTFYTLGEVEASVRWLLTMRVQALVFPITDPTNTVLKHFCGDPEVIVSPYGGQGTAAATIR